MGLNFGGPAVLGLAPVRPVTLRRHLSMVLPLSKLRREGQLKSDLQLSLKPPGHPFVRRLHVAGKKSIGYEIVTACTPSFAPKLIVLTRFTT